VFIKRNKSRHAGKRYRSVLLVQGERVPAKRGRGRPRAGEPRKTTVVHRTLANLSHMPPALIDVIEQWVEAERRGESLQLAAAADPIIGRAFGPLGATLALARQLGIEKALGRSRHARLALFLVLARVLHRGSRLSAVRWAQTQAVPEALGLSRFDEDDLYAALDWLAQQQPRIERELMQARGRPTVYLYDVTSSYFEGQHNALAAPGYNRDGKRFKKQIVVGLLTDGEGEPLSVQVYEGNTADPKTVADQVKKLSEQFGARDVALVGDRGMLKGPQRELLGKAGLRFITALTEPEIRKRLSDGVLQLELFSSEIAEVVERGVRHVLRRNDATAARHHSRRDDQLRVVQKKVDARNALLATRARARADVSLAQAERWLTRYKLAGFVTARLDARRVVLDVDAQRRTKLEELDGCYVVTSDLSTDAASKQTLWDRYGELQRVERDFRTMKTTLLELRPIFLRKAGRTRAHAFVTMLALKISRALARCIAPLPITVEDALDRLDAVRLLTLADPALALWRLPAKFDAPQREILDLLPPLPAPMLSPQRAAS
jgi:hypothetical protein